MLWHASVALSAVLLATDIMVDKIHLKFEKKAEMICSSVQPDFIDGMEISRKGTLS